jgi:hypothetical protein
MEGSATNEFKVAAGPVGGKSGLSFGFVQNDVAQQGILSSTGMSAKEILTQALTNAGMSSNEVATLVNLAATPGVQLSEFTTQQIDLMQAALAADAPVRPRSAGTPPPSECARPILARLPAGEPAASAA